MKDSENREKKILSRIADGDQLSMKEYLYVTKHVREGNFLVFGTGADTPYWKLVNPEVTFLEDHGEWLDRSDPKQIEVKYNTTRDLSDSLLTLYKSNLTKSLEIDIPQWVRDTKWDNIFVDGPQGYNDKKPGRMQSLYTAKQLANSDTNIFVHDAFRHVESTWVDALFTVKNQFDRMKHCKI